MSDLTEIAELARTADPDEILERGAEIATKRAKLFRELAKLGQEGEILTAAGFLLGLRRADLVRHPFSDKELSNIQNRYGLKRQDLADLTKAARGDLEKLIQLWLPHAENALEAWDEKQQTDKKARRRST